MNMKLYIYDHCPFCVRARMIFGLRGVEVENIILANDDEDTPIGMIGAKQVPILEKDDGTFMGESLDIVHYIDETAGKGRLNTTTALPSRAWSKSACLSSPPNQRYNTSLIKKRKTSATSKPT